MEAVNIFSAENAEGRVDVARAVGSRPSRASGATKQMFRKEYL